MKKLLAGLICLLLYSLPTFGQKDIFGGFFDKEAPVFHTSIVPTADSGTVMMVYHYTHSKASSIEASVWIKDLGTKLLGNGVKKLVRGLRETGNRQQDTLLLEGLSDLHFYNIGLDYRNPNSLTRKFTSKVIEEGYQYRYVARFAMAKKETIKEAQTVIPPINFQESTITQDPCQDPRISVMFAQSGYCGDADRPAIQVECVNCDQRNWQFSVELRTAYGNWQPLRLDGRPQAAYGNSVRTEPLCTLQPETYYARVMAWGDHCSSPIIANLSAPIIIPGAQNTTAIPPIPPAMTERGPAIPDTCVVYANAQLVGNILRGTVELPANSPCASFEPYAKLRYLHPGYRDINVDNLELFAGSIVPFELTLDAKDLTRGIHPVQVAVFVDVDNRSIAVGSFWIKAETDPVPVLPAEEPLVLQPIKDPYATQPSSGEVMASRGGTEDTYYDETLLDESMDTISVRASDPNCTQIQNLQLVYDPAVPNQPLYISWLSPRCCQEEGCGYSVWVGKPGQLKLLVSGSKSGAVIRELLPQLQANDDYFEVVVKTSNGSRKAAYVLGEGPKYGFEEILAYQDRFNPPKSEPVVFNKGTTLVPTTVSYQKPQRPISDFKPCRIHRDFKVEGDQPITSGDVVKLKYDFAASGYEYTLYHQPAGDKEWVVAPGTQQLQSSPNFEIEAESIHNGKYLILSYKPDKNWGCLSAPLDKAISLEIE